MAAQWMNSTPPGIYQDSAKINQWPSRLEDLKTL